MAIVTPTIYNPSSGRIIGSFVYAMICEEAQAIHIKIGMSIDPIKRLHAIRGSSALTPRVLATVAVPSKDMARRLESSLHFGLDRWRTSGEWFRFTKDDKSAFNAISAAVLASYSSPSMQLKWNKASATQIFKSSDERRRHWWRTTARRGRAFKDAVAAGL